MNLEVEIPAACTESRAVWRNTETADSVLMTIEQRNTTALQHVPHVDHIVVVAAEQQTTFHTHTHTPHLLGELTQSLTSLFSTNMAISETKGQGWRAIPTQ